MKILAIIPARGGSKSVPMKNIKILGGKPLLAYTVDAAKHSKLLFKTIVSTDDLAISQVAKSLNVEVPFLRPSHLAQDNTPTIDVVVDVLKWYENQDVFFDAVCLLQPTTPFRSIDFIDLAIQKFIYNDTDSLISVLPVPHEYNPHWCFEANENNILNIATGEKNIISRRQDLPKTYHRDGSIYLTKTTVILNQSSFYGNSISYIESDALNYVNIDTPTDWEKAENLLNNYNL
jgi:CMP-N,N'-diacetyllegionaminic acid synthase